MFGLYDTVDQCWFGDDSGPKLFDDELLARVAAQVLDVQLQNEPGRTKATLYGGGATTLRDEKTAQMTPLQALRLIELGGL